MNVNQTHYQGLHNTPLLIATLNNTHTTQHRQVRYTCQTIMLPSITVFHDNTQVPQKTIDFQEYEETRDKEQWSEQNQHLCWVEISTSSSNSTTPPSTRTPPPTATPPTTEKDQHPPHRLLLRPSMYQIQ